MPLTLINCPKLPKLTPESEASPRVVTSLVALSAALFLLLAIRMMAPWARTHDFLNFYGTAVLSQRGEIAEVYRGSALLDVERTLKAGHSAVDIFPFFSRPPFYAAALAPLAHLSYSRAYTLWVAIQVATLVACCAWATATFGGGALVCMWLYLPAVLGIAHGQDCAFPLLIVVAAYALASEQKSFATGAVLALGLFKFHLFVLWPLVLVVQKRWRMLAGFVMIAAAEISLSVYAAGVQGILSYIHLLSGFDSEVLLPAPEKVVSLWGALSSFHLTHWTWAIAFVPVVAFLLIACRKGGLDQLFSTAISGSLIIVPHVYLYDATVLALPLWLAIFHCKDRAVRAVAIMLFSPVVFLFLLVFGKPITAIPALLLACFAILVARSKDWLSTRSELSTDPCLSC